MSILFKYLLKFYIFLSTSLLAVSAPPYFFQVEQPDGSKIPIRMFGHEYYNWLETKEGYVIDWIKDDTRLGWYYCELDEDGKYTTSQARVTYPDPTTLGIPKFLREASPIVRKINHSHIESSYHRSSSLNRSTSTLTKIQLRVVPEIIL